MKGHTPDATGLYIKLCNCAFDETWRGEAEVEEPSVATALAGEAAKALVASSHCGAFQPQGEPVQKELAVARSEGARGLGCPLAFTEGRDTLA